MAQKGKARPNVSFSQLCGRLLVRPTKWDLCGEFLSVRLLDLRLVGQKFPRCSKVWEVRMPSPTNRAIPPDIAAILKKIDHMLDSDDEQNRTVPEPFRSQIADGLDCDELPEAKGEFGRSPTNPIPTNGPIGEVIYLSRLRTASGSPVMFHRVRSEDGLIGAVDVYEVLSLDGTVNETLFLSMYHPRKSKKVPHGYTYTSKLDPDNFTYGVNHIVANFPQKLDAHIRKWQMDTFGIPFPVARVRETINGSQFEISFLDDAVERTDPGSAKREMRDDFLKLLHASQDPRFKDKMVAIGTDGIVRPMHPPMDDVAVRKSDNMTIGKIASMVFTILLYALIAIFVAYFFSFYFVQYNF